MRRLWRILVWIIGITIFLAAFGVWQWQALLDRQGISDVQWELRKLGFNQLQLTQLSFITTQSGHHLEIATNDVDVQWHWNNFAPTVTSVNLGDTNLVVNSAAASEEDSSPFVLPEDWRLPDALPAHIAVERLQVDLPCARGRCLITSRARGLWLEDVFTLHMQVLDAPGAVTADIVYESSQHQPKLRLALIASDLIQLNGETRLSANKLWHGEVQVNTQPPGADWLAYFQNWYAFDSAPAKAFDQPARMSAEWNLALAALFAEQTGAASTDMAVESDFSPDAAPAEEASTQEPSPQELSAQELSAQELSVQELPAQELPAQQLNENNYSSDGTPHVGSLDLKSALAAIRNRLQGDFKLTLNLPSPLPVPGLGGLSGQARIDLAADADVFTTYLIDADLQLAPVTLPESFNQYDVSLDQLRVTLDSRSGEAVNLRAIPLQLAVEGEGNIKFATSASLLLDSENLAVKIPDANLQFSAASWSPVAGVSLANMSLETRFSAQWQPESLRYTLLQPGQLQADISTADITIKGGKLVLETLTFNGVPVSWLDSELQTTANLSIKQLVQAQLHPQPWRWQGEIKAGERQALLQGKLTANENLTLDHQLTLNEQRWLLDWQLPDIFLLAGNSLQQLTPHWPPLLTLQRGRVGGEGQFNSAWQENSAVTGKADLRLADVAGIYDTTAFTGVSGKINIGLTAESLKLASENLTANEIIQGFTVGPAQAAFAFTAPLASPAAGQLRIDKLQTALLGGTVEIPPATLDFSQPEQQLQVEITELDLGRLLAEHPSSDLTGSGRLSGRVPLTLSEQGVSVSGGTLAARPPGGHLQYRSARAADLAASSQGMKIITDALDDFHYTLLSSEVSYDAGGTLLLGVRLEGKNPAVEAGRPINFNINLEEDLPAMIYSLQLTNQLNEIIKQRVQEKMRAKPSP